MKLPRQTLISHLLGRRYLPVFRIERPIFPVLVFVFVTETLAVRLLQRATATRGVEVQREGGLVRVGAGASRLVLPVGVNRGQGGGAGVPWGTGGHLKRVFRNRLIWDFGF